MVKGRLSDLRRPAPHTALVWLPKRNWSLKNATSSTSVPCRLRLKTPRKVPPQGSRPEPYAVLAPFSAAELWVLSPTVVAFPLLSTHSDRVRMHLLDLGGPGVSRSFARGGCKGWEHQLAYGWRGL